MPSTFNGAFRLSGCSETGQVDGQGCVVSAEAPRNKIRRLSWPQRCEWAQRDRGRHPCPLQEVAKIEGRGSSDGTCFRWWSVSKASVPSHSFIRTKSFAATKCTKNASCNNTQRLPVHIRVSIIIVVVGERGQDIHGRHVSKRRQYSSPERCQRR